MNEAAFQQLILRFVRECGTQSAAAQRLGVSGGYLNDLYYGRRKPGPKILAALGYKRVVAYERVA